MNKLATTIHEKMLALGQAARAAAHILALTSNLDKNNALHAMAKRIRNSQFEIQQANEHDVVNAKKNGYPTAFIERLLLTPARILAMAESLEAIAEFPDPVGIVLENITRPNGLEITRISVPIGVLGVIYESRPNVTADAAGLCLKSGNAVILRGGSAGFNSATAILAALKAGLADANLPLAAVQMLPTPDRGALHEMLAMEKYIDVIIPRGGPNLIKQITATTRIPLFKHLAGLCHTYIHSAADKEMAKKIILNAKMRRTSICGATEVLLIDQAILYSHLPAILDELIAAGCEIRGDAQVAKLDPRVKPSKEQDFDTEFLDAIIAVTVVNDLNAALQHIAQHSTQHTEAIITEDQATAEKFLASVDSAIVMHNTSTQFADGGEFGMGAEIGIATGKLHARGPVGIKQLTTFKYLVRGHGQIRS